MEQSNIVDLSVWATTLSKDLNWEDPIFTEGGEWSLSLGGSMSVLIEPNPEMESTHIIFTGKVMEVNSNSSLEAALKLFALNTYRPNNESPVVSFDPLMNSINLIVHFNPENKDEWNFDNFRGLLFAFSNLLTLILEKVDSGELFSEISLEGKKMQTQTNFA